DVFFQLVYRVFEICHKFALPHLVACLVHPVLLASVLDIGHVFGIKITSDQGSCRLLNLRVGCITATPVGYKAFVVARVSARYRCCGPRRFHHRSRKPTGCRRNPPSIPPTIAAVVVFATLHYRADNGVTEVFLIRGEKNTRVHDRGLLQCGVNSVVLEMAV
ncbi:hypothetical protein F443_23005, partial [Phytophthora nicotianae P1569]